MKVAKNKRTPNDSPTPIPTFVAFLDDGAIDADADADAEGVIDVLIVVVEDIAGEEEGHGVPTSPIISATVDSALEPGMVKFSQPGVSPQIHDLTA